MLCIQVLLLLYIHDKFTMETLTSFLSSLAFVLNRLSLSISGCMSRYEAVLNVSVVFFISSSVG